MPATITIVTPENVEITYEVAGLGSRGLAALVAFLASDRAGYITGQNLVMDGGAYPGTL